MNSNSLSFLTTGKTSLHKASKKGLSDVERGDATSNSRSAWRALLRAGLRQQAARAASARACVANLHVEAAQAGPGMHTEHSLGEEDAA